MVHISFCSGGQSSDSWPVSRWTWISSAWVHILSPIDIYMLMIDLHSWPVSRFTWTSWWVHILLPFDKYMLIMNLDSSWTIMWVCCFFLHRAHMTPYKLNHLHPSQQVNVIHAPSFFMLKISYPIVICPRCPKSFTSGSNLSRHIKQVHPEFDYFAWKNPRQWRRWLPVPRFSLDSFPRNCECR
jgi:hypothetical protein